MLFLFVCKTVRQQFGCQMSLVVKGRQCMKRTDGLFIWYGNEQGYRESISFKQTDISPRDWLQCVQPTDSAFTRHAESLSEQIAWLLQFSLQSACPLIVIVALSCQRYIHATTESVGRRSWPEGICKSSQSSLSMLLEVDENALTLWSALSCPVLAFVLFALFSFRGWLWQMDLSNIFLNIVRAPLLSYIFVAHSHE